MRRLVCYIFFCCVMLYEELKRELSFVHKVLDKRYEREYYVNPKRFAAFIFVGGSNDGGQGKSKEGILY